MPGRRAALLLPPSSLVLCQALYNNNHIHKPLTPPADATTVQTPSEDGNTIKCSRTGGHFPICELRGKRVPSA